MPIKNVFIITMSKRMRLLVCLIITSVSLIACSNLSKSESTLRHNYLAITQPGIGIEEAVILIKTRIKPEGSLMVRKGVPCLDREDISRQIGRHSIRVNLGWYYWGIMETPVYGEWCFNDNEKLINIVIIKNIDDSADHSNAGRSLGQY